MHPTHPEPAMEWGKCLFLECVLLFPFFLSQPNSPIYMVRGGSWVHQDGGGCQEREQWEGLTFVLLVLSCA